MGANCCIAAKQRSQPSLASVEVSAYRINHSPPWSFRWDNRTHIEDIMENNTAFSNHSSGDIQPEPKSGSIASTGGLAVDGRADVFRRVKWHRSDKKMEASKLPKVDPRGKDQSIEENSPPEVSSHKSLDVVNLASDMKTSESLPSMPLLGLKAEPEDPSSSMNHSDSTGKTCQSPGDQLYSQMTYGNTPSLKTFGDNSFLQRRPSSSTLLSGSDDLFAGLSHGELSNELSSGTPSESVASSQRDGWLVDNEPVDPIASKLSGSSASHPTALSPDQGVCKLCSKLLKERSAWSGHELAVVAVLFCGHAYHANCLDSITAETDRYDPPCPVCTHGELFTTKLFGKLESRVKNNKTLKIMSNSDLDRSSKHQKKSIRPRMGTSSSMKESFSKPFLKRHFSTSSRPPKSDLESKPTRKKGFWPRHWRE